MRFKREPQDSKCSIGTKYEHQPKCLQNSWLHNPLPHPARKTNCNLVEQLLSSETKWCKSAFRQVQTQTAHSQFPLVTCIMKFGYISFIFAICMMAATGFEIGKGWHSLTCKFNQLYCICTEKAKDRTICTGCSGTNTGCSSTEYCFGGRNFSTVCFKVKTNVSNLT